ncbi:GYD domain-containing protein [Chloroflexota bacterium]
MPTYISLINWTQEGIKSVKGSPNRLDAAKEAFKAAGAELKEFYLVCARSV